MVGKMSIDLYRGRSDRYGAVDLYWGRCGTELGD